MFHTLFIDLDNTIYPKSSGLMDAIRDRIISYMGNVMNMTEEEIRMTREYSLKKYGTTLIGLMELYGIDKQHYLDYVHDLALEDFLTRDPELASILNALPQRKIIFSNADLGHVYRVLDYLQIREFFCHIIDVHMLMPNVKPQPEAFTKALAATELSSWEGCAFIDDYPANVLAAEKLGIFSILVDEAGEQNHANCIPSIGNLNDFFHANRI
jgi:pyrimidine 5'-nucleotidase